MEQDDICYICYEKNNNESVLLNCKHRFHHDCLTQTYTYNKIKECPYCRHKYKYIPLIEGKTPIHGLHKEYQSNFMFSSNVNYCKGHLKNSKPCQFRAYSNGYCKRHEKQFINVDSLS